MFLRKFVSLITIKKLLIENNGKYISGHGNFLISIFTKMEHVNVVYRLNKQIFPPKYSYFHIGTVGKTAF